MTAMVCYKESKCWFAAEEISCTIIGSWQETKQSRPQETVAKTRWLLELLVTGTGANPGPSRPSKAFEGLKQLVQRRFRSPLKSATKSECL